MCRTRIFSSRSRNIWWGLTISNTINKIVHHLRHKKYLRKLNKNLSRLNLNSSEKSNPSSLKSNKPIVEIVTLGNINDASYRLKIDSLIKEKSKSFDFRKYGQGNENTVAVLIHKRSSVYALKPDFKKNRPNAVVMLFISDLVKSESEKFVNIPEFIDVILVPTYEMKYHLESLTKCKVELLLDPIDFNFNKSLNSKRESLTKKIIKVVWFGNPESYYKSMGCFEESLEDLTSSKEIEFHIVSKNSFNFTKKFYIFHDYKITTFQNLIEEFDICISSHTPSDFSISTFWKSENKAILAINRGLPVVASRTPAHERLFDECNLIQYLFSSGEELKANLRKLNSEKERKKFLNSSQNYVLEKYSSKKISDDWHFIYKKYSS